ncbi:lysophospholipid acyltransferase family protein (DUF374 domain) [Campylobacter iguaniorum]|uniref:lysophospholipid acyltransferase family protein n=1 Tax=Campylobacter iguaniorum TaxID=1244531 RepID=UPI00073A39DD|nr:lysophospholipid acyltransferase family protein [Campylobacter iguaniorum]ALV25133.1 lysophospholipid acyltransferase family protein (DUF374 domain) [Campylobacter iguaniorum]
MDKSFKLKDKIFIWLAEFIILLIMRIIYMTCKKEFIGKPVGQKACVVLFWHGKIAMLPFVFKKWWINKQAKVIISDHKDGQIVSGVSASFGIGTIRGSSSKGAVKALLQALKEIKSGTDVVITPDGPRGPRHSVSDGCVIIPQKTKSDLVILNYNASKFWQFKSWDGMILPKPFSKITYTISEPFSMQDMSMDEAKIFISQKMQEFAS